MDKGRNKLELDQEGAELRETLWAIIVEHVPAGITGCAGEYLDGLMVNKLMLAHLELAHLYRALVGLMPEHDPQIRAAYAASVFTDGLMDEEEWERFQGWGEGDCHA